MSRGKDIEFLIGNLSYIYQLSVAVKELRGKYLSLLGVDLGKIIDSSLVRNYLLCVANLLDPAEDRMGNRNITIDVFQDADLSSYANLIERIKTHRSKAIAHNDQAVMHQRDDYFRTYNITPEEVENFLEHMMQTAEKEMTNKFPREKMAKDIEVQFARLFN